MGRSMAKEGIPMLMEIAMKDNSKITKLMGLVSSSKKMEEEFREVGKMIM